MYPKTTTIYDQTNRISLFNILFPEMDNAGHKKLSYAYEKYHEGIDPNQKEFSAHFEVYHRFLRDNQAVDLSAIIWQANHELKNSQDNFTQKYKCLAVDEFQDSNPVQYEFVRLLSSGKHVFAIGDPNQSIYGFRGSDIRLFYQAEADLQATRIVLQKNYRTPPSILKAADEVIRHNSLAGETHAEAVKTSDVEIKQYIAESATEEAGYIATQVLNYVGGVDALSTGQLLSDYDYAFSDIAVLYRTHRIGSQIIHQLKAKGIPVLLSDGSSFLSEAPFDLVANALQLLQNQHNMVALSQLIDHLLSITKEQKQLLLKNFMEGNTTFEHLSDDQHWKEWISLHRQLSSGFETRNPGTVLEPLLDFFLPVTDTLTEDVLIKREMLLKAASDTADNVAFFLQKLILSPYTDMGRLNSGGVRLLTFHAAKGLEFPVVIIAGAEAGITPLDRQDSDLEEERRLFYVAMTRAKEELQIVRCKKRKLYAIA